MPRPVTLFTGQWADLPLEQLKPAGAVCAKCGADAFQKETDILDVWIDSGVSAAVVCDTHPELSRDDYGKFIYLEGSDQHRGWFHSSLLFNLAAISQMMPSFEDEIGPWATLVVLTLTQAGAAAGHVVWYDPAAPTAGASGIAFGLIGFGVAFFQKTQRRFRHRKKVAGHSKEREFLVIQN